MHSENFSICANAWAERCRCPSLPGRSLSQADEAVLNAGEEVFTPAGTRMYERAAPPLRPDHHLKLGKGILALFGRSPNLCRREWGRNHPQSVIRQSSTQFKQPL